MPSLLYIHGFLSSPNSHKAIQVRDYLAAERPDIDYYCPFLTVYPDQVQAELDALLGELMAKGPVYLMGSSMGGFWSTYLAEKYNLPALLINPAVKPSMLMPEYVGKPLQNYHTDDRYSLQAEHIEQLRRLMPERIERPDNYWVLLQTADETLDYRLAESLYGDCRLTLEEGGDHAFQGFERFIEPALEFFARFRRN
ncbi:MAG: esterase YqiA [Cellvibrionaceae bacterium]|nr:esterase YqiA [Cellvibrionaceae bacterium]MCV6624908.1 esterase YqiA [Cellvibrionaceae bacterium]